MLSTAPITSADLTATSFAYIDCDLHEDQTLVAWRLERDAARAAARRDRRRRFSRPRLLPMRWAT